MFAPNGTWAETVYNAILAKYRSASSRCCTPTSSWAIYKRLTQLTATEHSTLPTLTSNSTMVLQLYAAPLSTASLRVAQVLHEKKVPFEFHPIDLGKKEQKAEGYLEKQPFGQVPYIVSVFL